IVDRRGGQQPVPNETGDVWLALNGEIWNYRELRKELVAAGHRFASESDSEAVVHAYEEHGLESLGRLHGMFAIAIWDGRRQRLVLARDRMGKKPPYYARGGDAPGFGAAIKALFARFPRFEDNRLEPGLVTHTVYMEEGKRRSLLKYDFLAGDSLYKRQLSNTAGTLIWASAGRGLRARLMNTARSLVHRARELRSSIGRRDA